MSDTEPKSSSNRTASDNHGRRADVTFTTPPAVDAEERLRIAIRRRWTPGDSFLWIGPIPIPISRSAWGEFFRKIGGTSRRPGR